MKTEEEIRKIEEVYKMDEDICFDSPFHDGFLTDEIEDAFEDMCTYSDIKLPVTKETLKNYANAFSRLKVYEKDYAKLSIDNIYDELEDNYNIEDAYDIAELEEVEKAIENFNKAKTHYISGDLLCYTDVSKEAYEYLLNEYEDEILEN